MSELSLRLERLRRWFSLAPRLADVEDPLGQQARLLLPRSVGLSEAGVAHALRHCLEKSVSDAQLTRVCHDISPSNAAHVLLAANVFTAPFRAIALALAASERVFVRASRREPQFTKLLHEASQGAFELVDELKPRAQEQLWAYGSDDTLRALAARLPRGVLFHPHGHGIGIAVVDAVVLRTDPELAQRLAWDVVAFDQRGCLSPRVVIVEAGLTAARAFAEALHAVLSRFDRSVPRGELSTSESAAVRRFQDTALYGTDAVFQGRSHTLAVVEAPRIPLLPPSGRQLLVVAAPEAPASLADLAPLVTQLGVACRPELLSSLVAALPRARIAALGDMQAPPFDGPVDRRVEPFVIGDSKTNWF